MEHEITKSQVDMTLGALLVMALDCLTVLLIVGALVLASWLRLTNGLILDIVLALIACYVLLFWAAGTWIKRFLYRAENRERAASDRVPTSRDTAAETGLAPAEQHALVHR